MKMVGRGSVQPFFFTPKLEIKKRGYNIRK